ncbi:MAG: hypothetical protein AMS16_01980 [Planctomycetes bacterium DG_58]|nr:MAG: hypothetical protein AMS16_01980 [Planctomycetes bacterium DG_58]
MVACVGCRQPASYRVEADRVATEIIRNKQKQALGKSEPFTIEPPANALRRRLLLGQRLPYAGNASLGTGSLPRPEHWPEKEYPPLREGATASAAPAADNETLKLTLMDALQVAAANSRDYQSQKEDVFRAALDLDLESDEFRSTFAGALESVTSADLSGSSAVVGVESGASLDWSRRLQSGAELTAGIALDLVKLLTQSRESSLGVLMDATISIPLMRGAGRHIVAEPMTQAERDVIYAVHTFERYKKTLAVRVASGYLSVLQQLDQVRNAEDNYRRVIAGARRARRLQDAGELDDIQVGQARQEELRGRDRWISAQQSYARSLDSFRITLGLPPDARVDLDRKELDRLAETARAVLAKTSDEAPAGPRRAEAEAEAVPADAKIELVPPSREGGGALEMEPDKAVRIALARRLDLRTAQGRVYDSQRGVIVAADALRAGVELEGAGGFGESRSLGSADQSNARIRPEKGSYGLGVLLELPFERTAERNTYRESYISLERAVRSAQELEDEIKLEVRDALRKLLRSREGFRIQAQAVKLAERRVTGTQLFLEAGRAQIRDVLEAQEALVSAQNELTAALVDYRVAELELQRDMSVLEVNEKGLWREYKPE